MMALYVALSYWQQRKVVYAYYAAYIVCIIITFRYDDLDYENPAYMPGVSYVVTLTETVAFALYSQFAMKLMDFRENDPPSYRLLRCMLMLLGGHRLAPAVHRPLCLIVKEMMHNISRHASAHHVAISLTCSEGSLRLTVSDDGVGFNPLTMQGRGNGLTSLRQRANCC